jgi:hypothetical protein
MVMMQEPLKLSEFWLVLPALTEMMDERGLSKAEVIEQLDQFLGDRPRPMAVQAAIRRLEAAPDELALRAALGAECLLAIDLDRHSG